MINKLMKTLVFLALLFVFNQKVIYDTIDKKVDSFAQIVEEECIDYFITDEVYLVFDYDKVNEAAEQTFSQYRIELEKESESAFYIIIKGFNKEIKEKLYIDKGEMYEKIN